MLVIEAIILLLKGSMERGLHHLCYRDFLNAISSLLKGIPRSFPLLLCDIFEAIAAEIQG